MSAKEQVLKVYPDAAGYASYNKKGDFLFRYTIKYDDGRRKLSKECYNIEQAWQSALTKINENNETRTKDNSTVL